MQNVRRQSYIYVLTHVSFWILYSAYTALYAKLLFPEDSVYFWDVFTYNAYRINVFYWVSFYLLPLWDQQKRKQAVGALLLLLAFTCLARWGLLVPLRPLLNPEEMTNLTSEPLRWHTFVLTSIYQVLDFVFAGVVYWFALRRERDKRRLERQLHETERARLLLEGATLQSRLNALQRQINPHFLYNTLNYIHYHASLYSESLADKIHSLSAIMRYGLAHDGSTEVPLLAEISHVEHYLTIQSARLAKGLHLDWKVKGNLTSHTVLPMTLMTFVENAFKHGHLKDSSDPLRVYLVARSDHFVFEVHNRTAQRRTLEPTTGVGVENTRQRLTLHYGERHRLRIDAPPDQHHVHLTIYQATTTADVPKTLVPHH